MVAALEQHTGAGRLTLDEFAARVERAVGAATLSELAAVTSDLPAVEERPRRDLPVVFAVAIVTLVLLAIFLALRG